MYFTRCAEKRDAEFVNAIFAEAVSSAQWLPLEARSNANFTKVSDTETVVVCCGQDGDVLGFVSVYEPESFIHHLYVAPNYQGLGVGTALLHSLEAWVPMPWHLKCVERNENALAYYLSQGWVEENRAQGPEGAYVLLKKSEA